MGWVDVGRRSRSATTVTRSLGGFFLLSGPLEALTPIDSFGSCKGLAGLLYWGGCTSALVAMEMICFPLPVHNSFFVPSFFSLFSSFPLTSLLCFWHFLLASLFLAFSFPLL